MNDSSFKKKIRNNFELKTIKKYVIFDLKLENILFNDVKFELLLKKNKE